MTKRSSEVGGRSDRVRVYRCRHPTRPTAPHSQPELHHRAILDTAAHTFAERGYTRATCAASPGARERCMGWYCATSTAKKPSSRHVRGPPAQRRRRRTRRPGAVHGRAGARPRDLPAPAGRARPETPFLAALLEGVTFSRYIARAGALAEMNAEHLIKHLADHIHALLYETAEVGRLTQAGSPTDVSRTDR